MQFQILGPLEASQDGSPVPLGGIKQRVLLAALLLDAGRVVSADRLIDDLWGEEAPSRARHNLQELISQLRRTLRTAGTGDRIVTHQTGYAIELVSGELDLHRFERLLSEGREALSSGDERDAATKIGEALALWRGPPFADLAFEEFAQQEIARLEELRKSVLEERIAIDLGLGRHAEIVGELQALVVTNPLRERLREQLMLALYRSGRQAEALEAYRDARRVLTEELGLDPSPALRNMEAAILDQDPNLDPPRPEEDHSASPTAPVPTVADHRSVGYARNARKTVTIVFSDITVAGDLGEQLDPEAKQPLMDRYLNQMQAVIMRHGGIVEKVMDDTLMAVFGMPRLHEDDALRAVRAVAEMREVRDRLNEELKRDRRVTVYARTGVNTGEVVAGDPSTGQRFVIGDAVNIAAKMARSAIPGEILIGRITYRLVKDAVTAEPIEPLTLMGRWQPVNALRLSHVTPGVPGLIRHLDSPMVGRTREFASLQQAFDRVLEEHSCHLFTVFGLAGVGKSRLIAAFVDALDDRATILSGRCLPYGEGIAFHPLAEALIDLAGLEPDDTPQTARRKLASLMIGDERADRIAECVGQALGIPGNETNPQEMLWGIRVLLELLAVDRPVVFTIDDLQWAEPKFLELLEYIADLAQDAPLLLACMARPELLDDHPAWAGGKLNATSLLLEPLGREECEALVGNLLAGGDVDERARARIVEAAEGHPLFLEEITALLVEDGRLVLDDRLWLATDDLSNVPIPPTISALLAARIDKLPLDERRLIDIASVMGQSFYSGAVRDLADDAPTADAGLAALIRKQFVRPETSDLLATDSLAFRHLLIRDAAYDAIPKETRAKLHERLADWLDAKTGTFDERDEIVGYHLEQAYRYRAELGLIGSREREIAVRACHHLSSAGRSAAARIDIPAASNLYNRAASLLDEDDDGYPELLWALGTTLNRLGEYGRSEPVLGEVIQIASSKGDIGLETRARLDRWFAWLSMDSKGLIERLPEDVGALLPGLEDRGDDLGLTKAWQLVAMGHWLACRYGAMHDPLALALEHARRADDRLEESEVLVASLQEWWEGPTPVAEGIQRCQEILREVTGDRKSEAEVFAPLGVFEAMRGNFDDARKLVNEHAGIMRDLGLAYLSWTNSIARWDIEMLAGDGASAEYAVRVPYDASPLSDTDQDRLTYVTRIAYALCAQRRYAEALALSDMAADRVVFVWDQILWRCASGKASAGLGELERGLSLTREAVALAQNTDAINLHGNALMDLAEVASLADQEMEAGSAIEAAIALYEQKGNLVSAARARSMLEGTSTA